MKETEFTVCTYNIHKGFNPSNTRLVLKELRAALRGVSADLVFLQEVVGANKRHARRFVDWPATPQIDFLAHELWPHAQYGKNCIYTDGHHGNAILSSIAMRDWFNIDVSAHRFEQRGILHCALQTAPVLHCFCLHFGLTPRGRDRQIERLCHFVAERAGPTDPVIVAGDFNDWNGKATARLERELGVSEVFHATVGEHARSYPARFPLFKLDRIYFRGLSLMEAFVLKGRPWTALSDHSPLVARFKPIV